MSHVIELRLIDKSDDANHGNVVIFQQSHMSEDDYRSLAVAWRVIHDLTRGDVHPFLFPLDFAVSASDAWGNFTPRLDASPGQAFEVAESPSGTFLQSAQPPAPENTDVEVRNHLTRGAITANLYRDGKLLAIKKDVAPDQSALFHFEPKIWIGVLPDVEEGQVLSREMREKVDTELDLEGVRSADIVMTGGGSGSGASAFEFSLENVLFT